MRGQERGGIGIDKRSERSGIASDLGQQPVVVGRTASFERLAAFLNQPQTHDVLEQAVRAVDTTFVGDVQLQCPLRQDGMRQFETHQRPCPGTDIGPVR